MNTLFFVFAIECVCDREEEYFVACFWKFDVFILYEKCW